MSVAPAQIPLELLVGAQMEFVLSGAKHDALLGGVGCIGAEALIDGGPVADFQGGKVTSLLGDAWATRSFVKGRADLYRVVCESGREVVVTLDHKMLTPAGWTPLRDLSVGDFVAQCGTENDDHRLGTPRDWTERYSWGPHRGDERFPHPVVVAAGKQQQAYALLSDGSDIPAGCACSDHHSIADSVNPVSPSAATGRLPDAACYTSWLGISQSGPLSPSLISPAGGAGQPPLGQLSSHRDSTLFSPCPLFALENSNAILSFWGRIRSISHERYGEFYDLTVPYAQHYAANGLWHHNSGKSIANVVKAFVFALNNPGAHGCLTATTYDQVRNVMLPAIRKKFGAAEGDYGSSNGPTWRSGSRMGA